MTIKNENHQYNVPRCINNICNEAICIEQLDDYLVELNLFDDETGHNAL